MTLTSDQARIISYLGIESRKKWANSQKLLRINKYNLSPKLCKKCNSPISYEKQRNNFCSSSCAQSINNSLRPRAPKFNCIKCGKQIHNRSHKMCVKCWNKERLERRIRDGGEIKSVTLRKYYVAIRGHQCEECKNTEWRNKPISLNTHHLDGNTFNNKSENIKLICPNCHAQTSNYCNKNIGNGNYKVIRIKKTRS
jgi:predicted nucleic-acid-binding Zn-ribbon protein